MDEQEEYVDQSAQRVIELAKQNRNLTVSLESAKDRASKAERQLEEVKQELESIKEKQERPAATPSTSKRSTDSLRNRLGILTVENNKLKTEVTKMKSVLTQEIGESWDLQKLLEGETKWRGRAQQIALLRSKLKHALSDTATDATVATVATPDVEDRNKAHLEDIKQNYRVHISEVEAEAAELRQSNAELKKHNDSLASRSKILERDSARLKEKLRLMVQKTKHDNELIEQLRRMPGRGESSPVSGPGRGRVQSTPVGSGPAIAQASDAQQELEDTVARLKDELEDKDARIAQVTAELEELRRVAQAEAAGAEETSKFQVNALAVETRNLQEIAEKYREHNGELAESLEKMTTRYQNEKRKSLKLGHDLSMLTSAAEPPKPNLNRQRDLEQQLEELEQELEFQLDGAHARVVSLTSALAAKEDEIKLCRQLVEEHKHAYDEALGELALQVQSGGAGGDPQVGRELMDLRGRYNRMVMLLSKHGIEY
ncbi:chromosome segregation protein [Carpediemonas membranifera]|uniref:Chromosome segregation protein n=1 Tax=Carpediemonas membranifera TaxID=201153 RepID=A0A8J6E280_9EUKA|nr:chromosome segregation protein [Carpediemonas membranifera]|eukprot:KAG9397299.1 chromosome segregation protein [Carpediemonas membranifera]